MYVWYFQFYEPSRKGLEVVCCGMSDTPTATKHIVPTKNCRRPSDLGVRVLAYVRAPVYVDFRCRDCRCSIWNEKMLTSYMRARTRVIIGFGESRPKKKKKMVNTQIGELRPRYFFRIGESRPRYFFRISELRPRYFLKCYAQNISF
jgi:hypothetical protein